MKGHARLNTELDCFHHLPSKANFRNGFSRKIVLGFDAAENEPSKLFCGHPRAHSSLSPRVALKPCRPSRSHLLPRTLHASPPEAPSEIQLRRKLRRRRKRPLTPFRTVNLTSVQSSLTEQRYSMLLLSI